MRIEWDAIMHRAIEIARHAKGAGEPPFGALVLDGSGNEIAAMSDQVSAYQDFTRHAETEVIRAAVAARGPHLSGCTLVTTVEPCPMCFTAAWLAGIARIVYGTTMAEVARVTADAQREVKVPVAQMNAMSGHQIELIGGVADQACLDLFSPEAIPRLRDRPRGRME
ncbi:MAG TPA: nucleoside deaminase [Steroidobacteraceae bacterium]|nr:nucleoside deaminase [Steroidobacteraceae bacterium]